MTLIVFLLERQHRYKVITLYRGVLGLGRAGKTPSPVHSLPIYLNRLACGENILVSARGLMLMVIVIIIKQLPFIKSFLWARHCGKCFTFASFTCHSKPVVTKFHHSHFTSEGIEVLRGLTTSQGHKPGKWLDWDSTAGRLLSKLRHLSATQLCSANEHSQGKYCLPNCTNSH